MVALLVAEKPSVGRDWGRLFAARPGCPVSLRGSKVWVTWCIGHLTQLAPPEAYQGSWRAWRPAGLPMLPARFRRVLQAATQAHAAAVGRLLQDPRVDEVVNACDAGREGELIFAGLAELFPIPRPVTRVWLSAMTAHAMREAWRARRPARDYAPLAAAARCRSQADWLVGLNVTRAATLGHRRGGGRALLPMGRVQTPTLAMLAARERAIAAFVKEPYWRLHVQLTGGQAPFWARWQDGRRNERIAQVSRAAELARLVAGGQGTVAELTRRRRQVPPPDLFDLTALQRKAHRRLGLTAQATLDVAQELYERHRAISYPRTDSRHLTAEGLSEALAALGPLATGPWREAAQAVAELARAGPAGGLPASWRRRLVEGGRIGDHPAIVPTACVPPPGRLGAAQAGVYALVVRRFLAALMPPCELAEAKLVACVRGQRLAATGVQVVAPGWHLAEAPDPPLPKASSLPAELAQGAEVQVVAVREEACSTQPPPRLGDAGLLAMMERAGAGGPGTQGGGDGAGRGGSGGSSGRGGPGGRGGPSDTGSRGARVGGTGQGLGTPATRAAVLEGLIARGLARREAGVMRITELGEMLVAAVERLPLASAELTAGWEARLEQVAQGRLGAQDFMREVEGLTCALVAHFLAGPAAGRERALGGPRCPACGRGHMVRGRSGWGCSQWRAGCPWRLSGAALDPATPAEVRPSGALLAR